MSSCGEAKLPADFEPTAPVSEKKKPRWHPPEVGKRQSAESLDHPLGPVTLRAPSIVAAEIAGQPEGESCLLGRVPIDANPLRDAVIAVGQAAVLSEKIPHTLGRSW